MIEVIKYILTQLNALYHSLMKMPSISADISHVKLLSEWIKAYQRKVKTNAIR